MLHVLTLLSIRTSLGPQKHSMVGDTPSPLQCANPSLLLCLTLLPDVQPFPLRCPKPSPPLNVQTLPTSMS